MDKLLFHPDVQLDIEESFVFYETQINGLGEDFIAELEQAYEAVIDFPSTWPFFKKGYRRYFLSRFPFAVIYRLVDESIYVVAVMHQSRKPNYWTKRL